MARTRLTAHQSSAVISGLLSIPTSRLPGTHLLNAYLDFRQCGWEWQGHSHPQLSLNSEDLTACKIASKTTVLPPTGVSLRWKRRNHLAEREAPNGPQGCGDEEIGTGMNADQGAR